MRDGDGVRIATLVALVCSLLIELTSCTMRGAGPGPICEECMSALWAINSRSWMETAEHHGRVMKQAAAQPPSQSVWRTKRREIL